MRIGFFDSGMGGLTVLHKAVTLMPQESFLYYADTLHVPYGPKPKQEVKQYIFDAVEQMNQTGIKALVIACNTATSIAVDDLRAAYSFPIVGIEPAVKPAVEKRKHPDNRVLVTATELTLREAKFQDLVAKVDNEHVVDALPLPELVTYCEQLEFREEIILPYLTEKLAPFDLRHYSTLVLGCTHFPFFKKHFRKVVPPHVDLIDGSLGTIRRLQQVMAQRGLLLEPAASNGQTDVLYTSSKESEAQQAMMKQAMTYLQEQV